MRVAARWAKGGSRIARVFRRFVVRDRGLISKSVITLYRPQVSEIFLGLPS